VSKTKSLLLDKEFENGINKKLPPTNVLPKAGLTLRGISSCFANHLQLSGLRNSIGQQMLSSEIENKSASVSADGTRNIPPSAIPRRCV